MEVYWGKNYYSCGKFGIAVGNLDIWQGIAEIGEL